MIWVGWALGPLPAQTILGFKDLKEDFISVCDPNPFLQFVLSCSKIFLHFELFAKQPQLHKPPQHQSVVMAAVKMRTNFLVIQIYLSWFR